MSFNDDKAHIVHDFWRNKTPAEMTRTEWESLCDGCGRCCLHKLEPDDDGQIYYLNAACRLLDLTTCRCRDYAQRHTQIPDCVPLHPDAPNEWRWLPETCAYRRLLEGRPLPHWHPLLTGRPSSTREAGMCVSGHAVCESSLKDLGEADILFTVQRSPASASAAG